MPTIDPSTTLTVSPEFLDALTVLYMYDMTMFSTVDAFGPYRSLSRQEAAKMLSNFAMNVLCRTPDTTLSTKYDDIRGVDPSLRPYIEYAYQL